MLQRESRPRVSGGLETLLQGSWDQAFLSGGAVPGGELRTALCAGEVVLKGGFSIFSTVLKPVLNRQYSTVWAILY